MLKSKGITRYRFNTFCKLCYKGETQKLTKMIRKYGPNILFEKFEDIDISPLHIASARGFVDIVKILIRTGSMINQLDDFGHSSLHFACKYGFIEIVQILLKAGALVNQCDKSGRSSLSIACIFGNTETVKLLIAAGAYVNEIDDHGTSTIGHASNIGHLEIVMILIAAGAKVNTTAYDGITPLHIASIRRHVEVIKVLIEAGASVNQADHNGCTSLYHAVDTTTRSIRTKNTDEATDDTARRRKLKVLNVLLKAGADGTISSYDGTTPLNLTCQVGDVEILKILIRRTKSVQHVTINQPDIHQYTPLFFGCFNGHIKVVKQLYQAGASLTTPTNDGRTPLIAAQQRGHTKIVKYLERKMNVLKD